MRFQTRTGSSVAMATESYVASTDFPLAGLELISNEMYSDVGAIEEMQVSLALEARADFLAQQELMEFYSITGGLHPQAAEVAVEHFITMASLTGLDAFGANSLSVESFENNNEHSLVMAIEGIVEKAKQAWEWVKKQLMALFNKLKGYYLTYIDKSGTLIRSCEKLKEKAIEYQKASYKPGDMSIKMDGATIGSMSTAGVLSAKDMEEGFKKYSAFLSKSTTSAKKADLEKKIASNAAIKLEDVKASAEAYSAEYKLAVENKVSNKKWSEGLSNRPAPADMSAMTKGTTGAPPITGAGDNNPTPLSPMAALIAARPEKAKKEAEDTTKSHGGNATEVSTDKRFGGYDGNKDYMFADLEPYLGSYYTGTTVSMVEIDGATYMSATQEWFKPAPTEAVKTLHEEKDVSVDLFGLANVIAVSDAIKDFATKVKANKTDWNSVSETAKKYIASVDKLHDTYSKLSAAGQKTPAARAVNVIINSTSKNTKGLFEPEGSVQTQGLKAASNAYNFLVRSVGAHKKD